MGTIEQIFHDFLVLFAMVNVIGNLPVFAELTCDMLKPARDKAFLIAVITGGSVVLVFALFGDLVLRNIFMVSTSAFKIAGGILVFIVAARGFLRGNFNSNHNETESDSVAVFPLGFPYLAGPGTILTTIILIQSSGRIYTAVTVVLVYLAIFPILKLAPFVEKLVGKIGISVIARILYIFICAKAVSFILDGFHLHV